VDERIPHQYKAFADVFSDKKSNKLPPPRLWDHKIELKPGAPSMLISYTIKLSAAEHEELKKFVDEHLERGTIQRLKSPYVASFFFIKKKNGKPRPVSWMQSMTSSITSFKSKVPQVNPVIRPARDPEKQGACAKPSGDLGSHDQIRNKSPDPSRVTTRDKSRDSIHFGRARSPLINKWQTMGMVCNQRRHVTPVIG
jgi:hypothetical protein